MKLIRQSDKKICGQASVATFCGITLEEACMFAGTWGQTNTAQLKRVLAAMSIGHDDRRILGFPPSYATALLYWKSPSGDHWTVWHNKKYYDPMAGVFRKPPRWLAGARVTSYLRVYP